MGKSRAAMKAELMKKAEALIDELLDWHVDLLVEAKAQNGVRTWQQ